MPDLSEAEIKAKIGDGTIFALSIDTAVFDKYGCHLDFAVLNKLDQSLIPLRPGAQDVVAGSEGSC
jgi:hypothetical protein